MVVLEPDPNVRAALRGAIEREGLGVVEVARAAMVVDLVADGAPAIVVLGLGELDAHAVSLVGTMRARAPRVHVIALCDPATEAERVQTLRGGADDVVERPFSQLELTARIVAAARRLRGEPPAPAAAASPGPAALEFGDVSLDLRARTLVVLGHPVNLTRREFDLLAYLARHPGRTYTREHLLAAVWSSSGEWQSETTVTEHVRRLRAKLEVDPSRPQWIVTVQGVGYRFTG